MVRRLRYLPLLLVILVNATALPQQVSELKTDWPVVRLWNNPTAQMAIMLGDVPYHSLKTAAEQLAPDVTVLLVTAGDDVRRREYATYHRALYLLTPRPVWWLSPAPSDGTWESRWWISGALTAENIAAAAAEKSADCLLLIDGPAQPGYGVGVGQEPDTKIIQAGSKNCVADSPTSIVDYPASFWPLRLFAAVMIILAYGFAFLALAARLGGEIGSLETAALAWLFGAGFLSTAMLWLDGLGFSLDKQLVILTIGGALLIFRQRGNLMELLAVTKRRRRAKAAGDVEQYVKLHYVSRLLLIAFILFQLVFIIFMAVGRPLTIWDSWVNWGSKGRTIFLENGLTPVLYADPSRQVMLLGYPPAIPLLEAWLYRWLGAADDRLVGILFVLTYLALGSFVYGFYRRRGKTGLTTLLIMGAALSLGHVTGLTAAAFTDLWLVVLSAVSAAYLVEWLESGPRGYLLMAAVSAGFLSWFKQEGMVLVLVLLISLCLTYFLCRKDKKWKFGRILAACGLIGAAAVLIGGPWRFFAAREAVLVSVFMPLTIENLLTNIARVPVILRLALMELANPRTGFVWLLVPAVLSFQYTHIGRIIRRPSVLLLIAPVLYLGIMSIPYLFSNFEPYQQHVLSSFFRINAHVMILLLLWMGMNIEAGS